MWKLNGKMKDENWIETWKVNTELKTETEN